MVDERENAQEEEKLSPSNAEPDSEPLDTGKSSSSEDAATISGDEKDPHWQERLQELNSQAWKKGSQLAQKTARELQLKKQLGATRAEKELNLKKMGQQIVDFCRERSLIPPLLQPALEGIQATEDKISLRENELRSLDEESSSGLSLLNRVKKTISRYAGYTRCKLDISLQRNELESKIASLGQFVYSRHDTLIEVFADSATIPGFFERIEQQEKRIEFLEEQIHNLE